MHDGVGRLLQAGRTAEEGELAAVGTAFVVDSEHMLTAAHIVADEPNELWFVLAPGGNNEISVAVRVAAIDAARDVALLVLDHAPSAEVGRTLAGVALPLADTARAEDVSVHGFPMGGNPTGVACDGRLVDHTARIGQVRALQLGLRELATADPVSPVGLSGAPVLHTDRGRTVAVGVVRGYARGVRRRAQGGVLYASVVAELHGWTPVAGALAAHARRRIGHPTRSPLERAEWSLADLVRADAAVTPLVGRDTEMASLTDWCARESARSARLMVGPPGQGKTRLVRELGDRLEVTGGWAAAELGTTPGGFDSDDLDAGLTLAAASGRSLLLVVDYAAEVGPWALKLLIARLWGPEPTPARWRLLLLSRHPGTWWDEVDGGLRAELLRGGVDVDADVELGPLAAAADARSAFYDTVLDHLRDHVRRYADSRGLALTRRPVRPALHRPEFGSPLLLHIAAVCALLPEAAPNARPATGDPLAPEGLVDRLLDLERDHHWLRRDPATGMIREGTRAAFRDLADGLRAPRRIEAAVAASTLTGAGSEYEAQAVVAAALGVGTTAAEDIAAWLRDLYPADHTWLPPLQPDLLGEELIARAVRAELESGAPVTASLPFRLLAACRHGQARRLLTVLLRAAERHPELADLVAGVPTDGGGRGPSLVAALPADLDLSEVVETLPRYHTHLLDVALILTQRLLVDAEAAEPELVIVDGVTVDATLERRATLLHALAIRLSGVGERVLAVEAAFSAATLLRSLHAALPDIYGANLARAMLVLANGQFEIGRAGDALDSIEQSVALYRSVELGEDEHELGTVLAQQAAVLWSTGEEAAAHAASSEAVALLRETVTRTGEHHVELAEVLKVRSVILAAAGGEEEAAQMAEESVALWRHVASTSTGVAHVGLAEAFTTLALRWSGVGRREDALAVCREAVTAYTELVHLEPAAFLPKLAMAVSNLAVLAGDAGHAAEALDHARRTVSLYGGLATQAPDVYSHRLAVALNNLVARLSVQELHEEALPVAREAMRRHRDLLDGTSARRMDYLRAAHNLSIAADETDNPTEALSAAIVATEIARELAAEDPDRWSRDLARVLDNLAQRYRASDIERACVLLQEAVDVSRRWADRGPPSRRADLAATLSNLATARLETGQDVAGLMAAEEALALLAPHLAEPPHPHAVTQARLLGARGRGRRRLDDLQGAMAGTLVSFHWRRALVEAEPKAHRGLLAAGVRDLLGLVAAGAPLLDGPLAPGLPAILETLEDDEPDGLVDAAHEYARALAARGHETASMPTLDEAVLVARAVRRLVPVEGTCTLLDALAAAVIVLDATTERDALGPANEALIVARELTHRAPVIGRPYLTVALRNALLAHDHAEEHAPLAALAEEELAACLEAADDDLGTDIRTLGMLATAFDHLAAVRGRQGRHPEAVAALTGALDLSRLLAEIGPETHTDYVLTLGFMLAQAHAEAGEIAEARAVFTEARDGYRDRHLEADKVPAELRAAFERASSALLPALEPDQ